MLRMARSVVASRGAGKRGVTLIELVVAITILLILTSAAIPIARTRIKRERERELRHDLWEMRDAIDRYKDAADRGAFQIKLGSEGYPPDLETRVNGVDVSGKKVRFLRRIPVDPMTGESEWNMLSTRDDWDSSMWGGENVFDVFSKSEALSLDGSFFEAYLQLARAYAAQKEYRGAQRALDQASQRIDTDPGRAQVKTLSGQLQEAAGDLQAATVAYASAVALDPTNVVAAQALARLTQK